MTKRNDGGPAFPVNGGSLIHEGMSLRDWFAGTAIASGKVPMPWENPRPDGGPSPEEQTRSKAYRVADAMLEDPDAE